MADDMSDFAATRRGAMGLGAAALAALVAGPSVARAAGPAKIPLAFKDPIWNRETAARIQADTNGEQVYGHATGSVSGVRPGEAIKPLFNFEVFSTIRVLRMKDGNYQRMTKEAVVYTDLKTGEVLEYWDNPYTHERVKVVPVANDPYNWIIADTVQPPALPGVVTDGKAVKGKKPYLENWSMLGPDMVLLTTDYHGYYPSRLDPVHWPRESPGKFIQSSELFRWFIPVADLEDPSKSFIAAYGSWVRVQPWMPWMLMGTAPGHVLYDGVFRATKSLDDIPKPVVAYMRKHYPTYFTAPTTWYGPNYSSLEHYAMEQKPAPVKK